MKKKEFKKLMKMMQLNQLSSKLDNPLPDGISEDEKLKAELYSKVREWSCEFFQNEASRLEEECHRVLNDNKKANAKMLKLYTDMDKKVALLNKRVKNISETVGVVKSNVKVTNDIWRLISIGYGISKSGCSPKKLRNQLKKKIDQSQSSRFLISSGDDKYMIK